MKKEIKLYNVLFPVWLLIIFPITWFIVIPGNFIVDSLVVFLGLYFLKIDRKKEFYKKTILWVFLFGFAADILGSLLILLTQWLFQDGLLYEYIGMPIVENPFDNVYCLLYLTFAVIITGVLIYIFNRFISFRTVIDKKIKRVMSLLLAVLTAPYLFLLPTTSFYGGNSENFTNHFIWSEYVYLELYTDVDGREENILEAEEGKSYNYTLATCLKDGINTARKIKKSFDGQSHYRAVFYSSEQGGKALEAIPIWSEDGGLYFKWEEDFYEIKDEYREEVFSEIKEIKENKIDAEVS